MQLAAGDWLNVFRFKTVTNCRVFLGYKTSWCERSDAEWSRLGLCKIPTQKHGAIWRDFARCFDQHMLENCITTTFPPANSIIEEPDWRHPWSRFHRAVKSSARRLALKPNSTFGVVEIHPRKLTCTLNNFKRKVVLQFSRGHVSLRGRLWNHIPLFNRELSTNWLRRVRSSILQLTPYWIPYDFPSFLVAFSLGNFHQFSNLRQKRAYERGLDAELEQFLGHGELFVHQWCYGFQ